MNEHLYSMVLLSIIRMIFAVGLKSWIWSTHSVRCSGYLCPRCTSTKMGEELSTYMSALWQICLDLSRESHWPLLNRFNSGMFSFKYQYCIE